MNTGLSFQPKKRLYLKIILISLLLVVLNTPVVQQVGHSQAAFATRSNYLPLTFRAGYQPVMLGTYSQVYIGTQQVWDDEYHALDAWAGKRLSLAGVFTDIFADPVVNLKRPIEMAWANGYTPFINLTMQYDIHVTARMIAEGYADNELHALGEIYANLANTHANKMSFFAPLQEMNGNWVPYGVDPQNFKLAYQRMQNIFAAEGVPPDSAKWVFAPNSASSEGDPPFESYYPGDEFVDVVGFSSYQFGYCSVASYKIWDSLDNLFGQYLVRMTAMAPSKPIFIAQTATTAYARKGVKDVGAKNIFLLDMYTYFANYPSVRGVMYYNRWHADCDWSFYQLGGEQYTGYQQGVANPAYGYIPPEDLRGMIFTWP